MDAGDVDRWIAMIEGDRWHAAYVPSAESREALGRLIEHHVSHRIYSRAELLSCLRVARAGLISADLDRPGALLDTRTIND